MILTGRETFQKFKFFKRNLGTEFSLHIFFSICLCAQVIFLVEVGRRTIFIICFILVTQVIIYFQRFSSGLIDFHCFLYDVADDYYSLSGPQVIFIWLCVCVWCVIHDQDLELFWLYVCGIIPFVLSWLLGRRK